jgi:hypothetical protein
MNHSNTQLTRTMSHDYLKFFVKTLTVLNMWPRNHSTTIKQYYVTTIVTITTFPILADLISQFYGK